MMWGSRRVLCFIAITDIFCLLLVRAEPVVLLDFEDNPQKIIEFSRSSSVNTYNIKVNEPSTYQFSVVLEQMHAWTCNGEHGTYPSVLIERGTSFETLCMTDVNFKSNHFKAAPFFWTSNGRISLTALGTWEMGDKTVFVATAFIEVGNCSLCPNTTFCCERSNCKGDPRPGPKFRSSNSLASIPARCIPLELVCNGHANCGMICNADESVETCGGGTRSSSPMPLPLVFTFYYILNKVCTSF